MDTTNIKELLRRECDYYPPEEIMDLFLNSMTEIHVRPKEALITAGERNGRVYVLADGVVRSVRWDETGAHTIAFATSGTLFLDYPSHCRNEPAMIQIESCCHSTLLFCPKSDFDRFLHDYPEFAYWQLRLAYFQLYFYDKKFSTIKGSARERLIALVKNCPIILEKVPLGMIASYLGITQVYLSRLRRELCR